MESTPGQSTKASLGMLDDHKIVRFNAKVLALCFFIIALDGFDTTLIGFIAPSLSGLWHINRHDLGPVVSAALLGIALGSFGAGPIADRYGRKKVLVSGVLFFAIMTLISPFSPNLSILTFLRLLTGIGLGATIPNASTLAAEFAPLRHRAAVVTTVLCGFTVGSSLGGFASAWLIREWGWQSVLFACGGLSLLYVPVLIVFLPESMQFLVTRVTSSTTSDPSRSITAGYTPTRNVRGIGAGSVNPVGPISKVLSDGYLIQSITLWSAFFLSSFTVYVLIGWLPMLASDAGFSTRDAAFAGGVFQAGGVLGVLALGRAMDRWNPHFALIVAYCASAGFIYLLGGSGHSLTWLTALACATGFSIAGANAGIFALAALTYPTDTRATGTSWMSGVGRFGAILSGFVGAHLLGSGWTLPQVASVLTLPILAAGVAILCKWTHQKRLGLPTIVAQKGIDGVSH